MTEVAIGSFFGSLAACVYIYVGYPALLFVLARLRPRPVLRRAVTPSISVIIAAHNEEGVIEGKILNTLGNGYPLGRLEIIVASDGSTDRTESIVRRMADPKVTLLALPRQGKLRALIAAERVASGEILVFTDADTTLVPGSLRYLAENFADEEVGGVSGRKGILRLEVGQAVGRSEGLYVRFDEWQKAQETRFGSVVASHGALHAVRRELFDPGENPAVADDLAISARVVIGGHRLVYDRRAAALVAPPFGSHAELRRKIRIAAQVVHALLGLGPALVTSGFYSLELISHKLLRYMVPFFLILALASNLLLAMSSRGIWLGILGLQLTFYGLAGAGTQNHRRAAGTNKFFSVPHYFCLVNLSAFFAVMSVLRGDRVTSWFPTGRVDLERQ